MMNVALFRALRALAMLVCTQSAVGCIPFLGGGPDCIDETRSLSARAQLGDSSYVHVGLHEARNARTKRTSSQSIIWGARLALPRDQVRSIQVREGQTRSDGRVLFTLDPAAATPGPPSLTIMTSQATWSSVIPFDVAYTALRHGQAYVDLRYATDPETRVQAALADQYPGGGDWQHAYCS